MLGCVGNRSSINQVARARHSAGSEGGARLSPTRGTTISGCRTAAHLASKIRPVWRKTVGARQLVRGHRPAGAAPSGTRGRHTPVLAHQLASARQEWSKTAKPRSLPGGIGLMSGSDRDADLAVSAQRLSGPLNSLVLAPTERACCKTRCMSGPWGEDGPAVERNHEF